MHRASWKAVSGARVNAIAAREERFGIYSYGVAEQSHEPGPDRETGLLHRVGAGESHAN